MTNGHFYWVRLLGQSLKMRVLRIAGGVLLMSASACGSVAPSPGGPSGTAPRIDPEARSTAPASAGTGLVSPSSVPSQPVASPRTQPAPSAIRDVTPSEAATPLPTAPAGTESFPAVLFAREHLGVQAIEGVQLEITRLQIARKDAYGPALDRIPEFRDADVVGQITFTLTNTAEFDHTVYPEFGFVDVNQESVSLSTYALAGAVVGTSLNGILQPHDVKTGAILFPLRMKPGQAVQRLAVSIAGPVRADGRDPGIDYEFDMRLSDA